MKIEMPKFEVVSGDQTGIPLFVRSKEYGDISTALVSPYSVFYFSSDRCGVGISYSSYDYFKEEYEVIRQYVPGETLSITM